jgi:hypothetical protein
MKGLPAESAKTMTPPASRSGLMAAYRYRSIPKLVQDGSVWLMIGKFRLAAGQAQHPAGEPGI